MATKFCEIFLLLLSYVVPVKSKWKISQNFVAFSEYINFTHLLLLLLMAFPILFIYCFSFYLQDDVWKVVKNEQISYMEQNIYSIYCIWVCNIQVCYLCTYIKFSKYHYKRCYKLITEQLNGRNWINFWGFYASKFMIQQFWILQLFMYLTIEPI